jgi:hypothetical protein
MEQEILGRLNSKLEELKQSLIENLAEGGAQDFAQYQSLCGRIGGLLIAQREINDLLRKLKELEDE